MIRAQVCFGVVGGRKKATLKCAFLSNNTIAQELQVFREHAQTAGISRTDELNGRFPEFVNTSDRPHRQCLTTSSQHLYIQLLHLKDNLGPATKTHKELSETVSRKLICVFMLITHLTWLQPVIGTDWSAKMVTFAGLWHFGEVPGTE